MGASLDLEFSVEFDFRCGIDYNHLQKALQARQRPLELVRIPGSEQDEFSVKDPNARDDNSLTLDNVLYFDLIREHVTSALGVSGINSRSSELEEVENDNLWTVTIISPKIDRTTFDQTYELGKDHGRV